MNLVDEQDDISRVLDILNKPLDPAFKLSAKLCAGDQSRQVKQIQLFVRETVWHIAACELLRNPLCNGCLSDARLANQAGIVLCSPVQNLNHTINFALTADNPVDLALLRLE